MREKQEVISRKDSKEALDVPLGKAKEENPDAI
jgi:hypothetical protein